jgi:hypothetical protein
MITSKKDLTVIGAGLSGICAAIAAARQGLSVALINNRPVLGGNSSSEMRMWTRGSTGGENIYSEEMGILGEMKLENLYRNPQGNVILWDEVLYDFVYAEPLIDLYLNTHISEIAMKGTTRIQSVSGYQQGTEKYLRFTSPVFIDASGDGTTGYLAGAAFADGREGREVYGERLAPEQSDDLKLGSSILFHTREARHPVRYIVPKYAYTRDQVRNLIGKGGRVVHERMSGTDYWWIEHGGMMDTIGNNQDIALELKKIVFGLWDYIKNSGEFPADNLTLEWVGSLPCKRESRRLKGEHVLTLNDIESGNYFEDGISYGGWYVDFHPPGGIYSNEEHCQQFPVSVFSIPMRSLYTRKVSNLLFTGRLVSTSHLAFASTRIMNTCALLGQAAGSAAVFMHNLNKTHHQINTHHIRELQENLVKNDMFIPGFVHTDTNDLALSAVISTSSTRPLVLDTCNMTLPLKEDFIVLVPELGDAELLLNFDAEDGVNNGDGIEISMHECENIAGFRPGRKIRSGRLQLEAGSDQWVPISLDSLELLETSEPLQEADSLEDAPAADRSAQDNTKSPGRSYIIILHSAEHVSLRCSEKSFTGFTGRFQGRKQLYNPCFRVLAGEGKPGNRVPRAVQTNRVNAGSICASSNLNNGYNRPYGSPNIWMSDACSAAWVACEWPEPTTIEEIRLYFNPDLSSERVNLKGESFSDHHGMFLKEQMPPELVRGYTISIDHDGKWEKTVGISNNIKRMAVHKLNKPYTTRKIRIDLTETWGSENYELFEIRVY